LIRIWDGRTVVDGVTNAVAVAVLHRRVHAAVSGVAGVDRTRVAVVARRVAQARDRREDPDPLIPLVGDEDAAVGERDRLGPAVDAPAERVAAVAAVRRTTVAGDRRDDRCGRQRTTPVPRDPPDAVVPLGR